MSQLDDFLEKAHAGGSLLQPVCLVYRMDGNSPDPDMRDSAGLGTLNCCDYFTFVGADTIILIEETQLDNQLNDLNSKYGYLNTRERNRHIGEIIRWENKLKVYGSLLVLCRLARSLTDAKEVGALSRKIDFWLVNSGSGSNDDLRVLDNLRDQLFQDLRSALRTGVNDVRILPTDKVVQKLPSHPSLNI